MKRLTIVLLFGLVACNTEKKALEKTQLYLFKHPDFTAGVCAEQFPDKPDSVIIRTDTIINIATMDSLVYDTLLLNHDTTLIRTIVKTVKIYINKDSIIYRENKAEQERLNLMLINCQNNNNVLLAKLDAVEKERDEWKGKARRKGWEFWGLIFLVIGAIGMKLYTKTKKISI